LSTDDLGVICGYYYRVGDPFRVGVAPGSGDPAAANENPAAARLEPLRVMGVAGSGAPATTMESPATTMESPATTMESGANESIDLFIVGTN